MKKDDSDVILIPEVVDDEEKKPARREQKPLAKTFSPFTIIPFVNNLSEWGIRSWRKVIKEETGLMEDLVEHGKAGGRLSDVGIEIEIDHLERLDTLREAQQKSKIGVKKDSVAERELDREKIKIEREIAEDEKAIRNLEKEGKTENERLKEQHEQERQNNFAWDEHKRKKKEARVATEVRQTAGLESLKTQLENEEEKKFLRREGLDNLNDGSAIQRKSWDKIKKSIENSVSQEHYRDEYKP